MRKFTRATKPQVLIENGTEWTARLVKRGSWKDWPQKNKRKLNHILLAEGLRHQTQEHCSYCDLTPIEPPGTETIDHYHPKSGPYGRLELAFEWTNLYFCCNHCQKQKREQSPLAALRPDSDDYDFNAYFQWNFETGQLLPNRVAPQDFQERAKETIKLFGLNEKHPGLRLTARDNYIAKGSNHLDSQSYRDFLERAV